MREISSIHSTSRLSHVSRARFVDDSQSTEANSEDCDVVGVMNERKIPGARVSMREMRSYMWLPALVTANILTSARLFLRKSVIVEITQASSNLSLSLSFSQTLFLSHTLSLFLYIYIYIYIYMHIYQCVRYIYIYI